MTVDMGQHQLRHPSVLQLGLEEGHMNLGTTKVDVEAVHTELMVEQGNRSVAFGRHEIYLENIRY